MLRLLVEARLQLDDADALLAVLRRFDERVREGGVLGRAIHRRLDPDDGLVGRSGLHERLDARCERVVRVMHEEVAMRNLREQVVVLRAHEPSLRVGDPRLVLQIGPVECVELAEVGEVEQAFDRIHARRTDSEPRLEPRQHRPRDRARDLEPHDGAEPPLAQLALDRLEQVIGVVRDLRVAVAGDAEGDALEDFHLGEEHRQEVPDHGLERQPKPLGADRHEARQSLRHLDARKPLLARRVVANEHAEAQRQAGDVRERLSRPDRERSEHRVDLAQEDSLELFDLLRRRVVDGADANALRGERGAEVVAPQLRLRRAELEHAHANLLERLLRRASVRQADGEPREHLVVEAGHSDHEELVDDVRDDPAELDAFEQRLRRVGGEVEHARHQRDGRELAVDQRLAGARDVGGRHGQLPSIPFA